MVNNNLQHINLGAPTSIEITENQYPNAELTVQSVIGLTNISINDSSDGTRCTKHGAMFEGLSLLQTIIDEHNEESSTEGYDITFDVSDYENVCVNGGTLRLTMKHGENTITAHWIIYDVTEGEADNITISDDGLLSVGSKYAYLKVIAIDKSDLSHKVEKVFVVGARYGDTDMARNVSAYPDYAVLLSHSSSRIARGIIERGSIIPPLAENILTYNETFPTINNVACCGEVVLLRADGNAYIDTGFKSSPDSHEEVEFMLDADKMVNADEVVYGLRFVEQGYGINVRKYLLQITAASNTLTDDSFVPDSEVVYKSKNYTDKTTNETIATLNEIKVKSHFSVSDNPTFSNCLFAQGNQKSGKAKNVLLICYIQNDNFFVPYEQNSKYGVLGLKDGVFLTTQSGMLTIENKNI